MSSKGKPNIGAGLIWIVLGLAFIGIGVLGVTYRMDPDNATRPFLKDDKQIITKHDASMAMIPLGFLAGIGLAGFGVFRMKPREEEADTEA